jgi:hypothetical protein
MKITVNQLRKIIKEEIQRIVSERIEYHPKIGDQEIGYERALKYVDGVGDEDPEATLQKVAKMLNVGDPNQVSFILGKVPHTGLSGFHILAGQKGQGPIYFFEPVDTEWREIPEKSID